MSIGKAAVEAVEGFVNERRKPSVVSLSADTHVFHFDPQGFWEDSPILLVNRNGHHFRLIEQAAGDWLFAKTWNGMFETLSWQTEANLRRPDAAKLINLCGVGPQGTRGPQFETLCLLPKGSTEGRRKAVWRNHMLDVSFNQDSNTFTLMSPGPNGSEVRQTFHGKLWESAEASEFCKQEFASQPPVIVSPAKSGPLTSDQVFALEDNPLWGMF